MVYERALSSILGIAVLQINFHLVSPILGKYSKGPG